MSLTDILPFDDHTLLSRPRRQSCLHKYSSLSRNLVRSSLILMFLVSLCERSFFRFFRIPNFVSTDFSLAIICRGPFRGSPTRWEFIMSSGESSIPALVVTSMILAFVSSACPRCESKVVSHIVPVRTCFISKRKTVQTFYMFYK